MVQIRSMYLLIMVLIIVVSVTSSPLMKSYRKEDRSAEEKDPEKLAKKYKYYQRPLYRYPYYDQKGQGQLLYGYGGPELFSYSVFQPLEGYYKK